MKYSTILALAGSALAAPAVVTETNVVYVTASAVTSSAQASASHAPQVGAVYEVIVSELIQVSGDSTKTFTTTYTQTESVPTASLSHSIVSASSAASSTYEEPESTATTSTPTTSKDTTTLTPTTTSEEETSTTEAATTTTSSSSTKDDTTTTSTSATATASSSSSDFATEILNAHNEKRALNGADDLTWSSTLEAYAQAYADEYDCSGTLTHSGGEYGENLGLGYTTTGVVDAWYDEISEYDSSNPTASHFTQVVWKSTTELGCAAVQCGSYWGQYTICSYNPAGNVAGEYADNVSV